MARWAAASSPAMRTASSTHLDASVSQDEPSVGTSPRPIARGYPGVGRAGAELRRQGRGWQRAGFDRAPAQQAIMSWNLMHLARYAREARHPVARQNRNAFKAQRRAQTGKGCRAEHQRNPGKPARAGRSPGIGADPVIRAADGSYFRRGHVSTLRRCATRASARARRTTAGRATPHSGRCQARHDHPVRWDFEGG